MALLEFWSTFRITKGVISGNMQLFVSSMAVDAMKVTDVDGMKVTVHFQSSSPQRALITFFQPPPKNGEIALLKATNRGYVVKNVSQKWNGSNTES